MADKNKFEGYSVVKATRNFMLVHKAVADPFDEKESQYYIVYKKYATIEAKANSFLMACDFLNQAEEMYSSLHSKERPVKEDKPTLQ